MYKHTYDIYTYAISCNLYIDSYIFVSILIYYSNIQGYTSTDSYIYPNTHLTHLWIYGGREGLFTKIDITKTQRHKLSKKWSELIWGKS